MPGSSGSNGLGKMIMTWVSSGTHIFIVGDSCAEGCCPDFVANLVSGHSFEECGSHKKEKATDATIHPG